MPHDVRMIIIGIIVGWLAILIAYAMGWIKGGNNA